MILSVLNNRTDSWSTYHRFKKTGTQISFNRKDENGEQLLFVSAGEYRKVLKYPQIRILTKLLNHVTDEKIEHATRSYIKGDQVSDRVREQDREDIPSDNGKRAPGQPPSPTTTIQGTITAQSDKPLLIKFSDGRECWIPRSMIRNHVSEDSPEPQSFQVESWILERNSIHA